VKIPESMNESQFDGLIEKLEYSKATIIFDVTEIVGKIDIRAVERGIDGLYIDTSKLPGGWQGHPVILLREDCFKNKLPLNVGGGVVHWTTDQSQRYVENRTALEDAGTPGILQGIRSGIIIGRLYHLGRNL